MMMIVVTAGATSMIVAGDEAEDTIEIGTKLIYSQPCVKRGFFMASNQ
jgi:hypothetical protein